MMKKYLPPIWVCLAVLLSFSFYASASDDQLGTAEFLIEEYLPELPPELDEQVGKAHYHIDQYWEANWEFPELNRDEFEEGTLGYDFPRVAQLNLNDYLNWLGEREEWNGPSLELEEARSSVSTLMGEIEWMVDPLGALTAWMNSEALLEQPNTEAVVTFQEFTNELASVEGVTVIEQIYEKQTTDYSNVAGRLAALRLQPNNEWQRVMATVDPNVVVPDQKPKQLNYNDCGAFRWGVDFSLKELPDAGGMMATTVHFDYQIQDAIGQNLYSPTWRLPFLETNPRSNFQFYIFDYIDPQVEKEDNPIYSLNMNFIDFPFGFHKTKGFIKIEFSTRLFEYEQNLGLNFIDANGNLPGGVLDAYRAEQYNAANQLHQRFRRFHGFPYGSALGHPKWENGSRAEIGSVESNWNCTGGIQNEGTEPATVPKAIQSNHSKTRWILNIENGNPFRGVIWQGRNTYPRGISPRLPLP